MCNFGVVNDIEEDKVWVWMMVRIWNDINVNFIIEEWFGLGFCYSII